MKNYIFDDCISLESINAGGNSPCYKSIDGVITINEAAFNNCKNLTHITIPDTANTTSIWQWVFYHCPKLKKILVDAGNAK